MRFTSLKGISTLKRRHSGITFHIYDFPGKSVFAARTFATSILAYSLFIMPHFLKTLMFAAYDLCHRAISLYTWVYVSARFVKMPNILCVHRRKANKYTRYRVREKYSYSKEITRSLGPLPRPPPSSHPLPKKKSQKYFCLLRSASFPRVTVHIAHKNSAYHLHAFSIDVQTKFGFSACSTTSPHMLCHIFIKKTRRKVTKIVKFKYHIRFCIYA